MWQPVGWQRRWHPESAPHRRPSIIGAPAIRADVRASVTNVSIDTLAIASGHAAGSLVTLRIASNSNPSVISYNTHPNARISGLAYCTHTHAPNQSVGCARIACNALGDHHAHTPELVVDSIGQWYGRSDKIEFSYSLNRHTPSSIMT
jgi:hypothetical protein